MPWMAGFSRCFAVSDRQAGFSSNEIIVTPSPEPYSWALKDCHQIVIIP